MKKQIFILLSLLYCAGNIAQQHEWRNLIDKKQFGEILLHAVDLQPSDSSDFSKMFYIGQAYEGLLKYKDAYNCYIHCYTLDSTRIDILNTLARISGSLGRVKEAETFYKKVIANDSTNFYANYQLARLYVQRGDNDTGIKYYDYLLEKDPENPILLRAKGDCYLNADSIYTSLMAAGDNVITTLKYCGVSRFYTHKWFDAIEPLE